MSNVTPNHTSLTGPWTRQHAMDFLTKTVIPLRLATIAPSGWPVIVSLWFLVEDNMIWCATHQSAKIIRILELNSQCAFEVAPDHPPYLGLRSQANVKLFPGRGADILKRLIDRYQGSRDSELARWLLSRSEEEVAIAITPVRIQSWDYSSRMLRVNKKI